MSLFRNLWACVFVCVSMHVGECVCVGWNVYVCKCVCMYVQAYLWILLLLWCSFKAEPKWVFLAVVKITMFQAWYKIVQRGSKFTAEERAKTDDRKMINIFPLDNKNQTRLLVSGPWLFRLPLKVYGAVITGKIKCKNWNNIYFL